MGTKAEFYRLLARLCAEGTAILFYSSDDEELIGLCDRVLVMHDGAIRSELSGESLTKANLIAASLGASNGGGKVSPGASNGSDRASLGASNGGAP